MHVRVRQRVDSGAVAAWDQLIGRDRPQIAEVHEEAVGALTGEDDEPVGHPVDGGRRQGGVVRGRADADVAGGAGERTAAGRTDDGRCALTRCRVSVDPRHGVCLPPVPRGAVARARRVGDGPGGVEERGGIQDRRGELELIGDGGDPRARVVDADVVEHVIPHRGRIADNRLCPEFEEVGATIGTLERHVVGDDGYRVRGVGTHECVDIRAVGSRVLGHGGCFSV